MDYIPYINITISAISFFILLALLFILQKINNSATQKQLQDLSTGMTSMEKKLLILTEDNSKLNSFLAGSIASVNKELAEHLRQNRIEVTNTLINFQNSLHLKVDNLSKNTTDTLNNGLNSLINLLSNNLEYLSNNTQESLLKLENTIKNSLKDIQESNTQ